jgi:hypothetical protein
MRSRSSSAKTNITFTTWRAFFTGSRSKAWSLERTFAIEPRVSKNGLPCPGITIAGSSFSIAESVSCAAAMYGLGAVCGPHEAHRLLPQRVARDEDAVHRLEEHQRVHVVPRRGVRFPLEAAALEGIARRDRVVVAERIGLLVELRHPGALRRPRVDVLHFSGRNGDAAAVGARDRRVAAHVVGMAMRVDDALERLAVEARAAREQLERALAMRAIARIHEYIVARSSITIWLQLSQPRTIGRMLAGRDGVTIQIIERRGG